MNKTKNPPGPGKQPTDIAVSIWSIYQSGASAGTEFLLERCGQDSHDHSAYRLTSRIGSEAPESSDSLAHAPRAASDRPFEPEEARNE